LPPPQAEQKVGGSLQGEINEFLRQAQAAREGRGAKPGQVPTAQSPSPINPSSGRPGDARQKRTARRQADRPSRPTVPPAVTQPVRLEEPRKQRESLAQHVADTLDSSKFARRATRLSQVQESSDSDFREHMQRIFQHGVGTLKDDPASGAAKETTASTKISGLQATTAAAAIAPVARQSSDHKVAAGIAAMLTGKKAIRDAVILTEILQRPEQRW
jgi:hypothetical protein